MAESVKHKDRFNIRFFLLLSVGSIGWFIYSFIVGFTYQDVDHAKATVEKVNGIYVFYKCEPVSEYTSLGDVSVGVTVSNKAGEMIDALTKRTHKKYETAQGIIITDQDMNSGSAILFK